MNKRWIWTAGLVLITALILATAVSADEGKACLTAVIFITLTKNRCLRRSDMNRQRC